MTTTETNRLQELANKTDKTTAETHEMLDLQSRATIKEVFGVDMAPNDVPVTKCTCDYHSRCK